MSQSTTFRAPLSSTSQTAVIATVGRQPQVVTFALDEIINGMGILPEYQRLGGAAILYHELEQTARQRSVTEVDVVQIAEANGPMQAELRTLGLESYKVHRVYSKPI